MSVSQAQAREVGYSLVRMVKLFGSMRHLAPRIRPGIENSAFTILFQVQDGPRRVSEIADCVHSDASTVSRQVSSLVAQGLLEKSADPDDKRAYAVSLTAGGKELLGELVSQRSRWLMTLLSDWSAADAGRFQAYIERFAGALDANREQLIASHGTRTVPIPRVEAGVARSATVPDAAAGSAPPSDTSPSARPARSSRKEK